MDVSEDLQRELHYGLNAALLRGKPRAADLAKVMIGILADEGPRHHEPDLLQDWADEAVIEREELEFELEQVLEQVLEELEDEEDPWSAHRILELLAEEPFWVLTWGLPGATLPARLHQARGVALPIVMRPGLKPILDTFEVVLFRAQQDQRSVHDPVPRKVVEAALDDTMEAIEILVRHFAKDSPEPVATTLVRAGGTLPSLREALARIQRWKLSPTFDASPDEDDGEWTLRVLERLYALEWTV